LNSPFDERKYKRLLKGLEASEVKLSELEYSGRIDAEYYKPSFLKYESIIKEKGSVSLSEISKFLIGPFGSAFTVDNYIKDKDYRYIRGKDVKPLRIMDDDNVYIPKKDFVRLSRYALKENDILISVVGTIGNAALVLKKDLPSIFSCKSTVLRPYSINPKYLVVYLNTKYGKELLLRKERGAIQKGLNLDDLKCLNIFVPSQSFQKSIEKKYDDSLQKYAQSKSFYRQAEALLLETIELSNFKPSTKATNIKSFKNSFLTTGRLDAEYYQPKYEEIESKIKKYKEGFSIISKQFKQNKTIFAASEKQYNYIEIGDVNVGNGSYVFNMIDVTELPANAKIKSKRGNLLISKVRPNRGAVTIINENILNLVVSGAFTILEEKGNYKKEVLFVLLRTPYYKEWLLKYNVGTSYPVIKDEDVLNLPIPLISDEIQQQIASLIEESFSLRRKSDKLLEEAKTMVEREIEK
jgi:restriction endonuclease S subunit